MTRYIVKFSNGHWTVCGSQRGTFICRFTKLRAALDFAAVLNG